MLWGPTMKSRPELTILSILLFVSTLTSTAVLAQSYDGYFSGNIGLGMMTDAELFNPGEVFDLGYSYGVATSAALGLASPVYRAELEMSYQQNDLNNLDYQGLDLGPGFSADTSAVPGLLIAYYDFNASNVLRPYITGGLGFSQGDLALDKEDLTNPQSGVDTAFSYQLGAGLGYAITDTLILDLRYRYLSVGKLELDANRFELESHNILAGIRIKF